MDKSLAVACSPVVKDSLSYCMNNEVASRTCGRADHVQVWSLLRSVLSRIVSGNSGLEEATKTSAAMPPFKSRRAALMDFIGVFRTL